MTNKSTAYNKWFCTNEAGQANLDFSSYLQRNKISGTVMVGWNTRSYLKNTSVTPELLYRGSSFMDSH